MTHLLPIFPLQLVAFPDEYLNLHIFEPRYIQLINECVEHKTTFGIPPFLNRQVQTFGTELEVIKVEKQYADGKMDVRTKGLHIFKILDSFSKVENKLYGGAEIERLPLILEGDFQMNEEILGMLGELFDMMNIQKKIPAHTSKFHVFQIAHHAGLNIEQEFELLKIPTELQRQEFMIKHFKKLIPTVRKMETMRKKIQMNGHFKNIIPPKW